MRSKNRPLLTSGLPRLVAVALLAAATAAYAQEPAPPDAGLQAQLDTIERQMADLQHLVESLPQYSGTRREALSYRFDQRLLRVLRHADELAGRLTELPADDPLVARLREQVANEFGQASDAIFGRLAELEERIAEKRAALADLSGTDRIEAAAQVDVLDALLEQYLSALARHLGVREKLGLDSPELKARVERQLRVRAEALAGSVVMVAGMVDEYRRQRSVGGDRAQLDPLLARASDRRDELLRRLRTATTVMTSLGMDTRDYESLLITQQGISFRLFDRDVLAQLAEEWGEAVKSFASNRGPDLLFNLLLFLAILFVFRLLSRLARRLVTAALNRSRGDLSQLLRDTTVNLTGGLVMVLGVLTALSQIGVSVGPMLAGLGIAGFIIGFALQDTLANFASGAMILIYRPFDVDDFVEVTGASGMVKRMNLVSTTITTFDNQTLVVPNSRIWGDVIKNVTHQDIRRVDLEFGIGYGDDIEKAERILAEAADAHELVLDTPETVVKLHSLGDSSVNLILRPWVKTGDYWTVYWDLTRQVKLRFDEEGVSIPYPQRDVHLYKA